MNLIPTVVAFIAAFINIPFIAASGLSGFGWFNFAAFGLCMGGVGFCIALLVVERYNQ